MEHVLSRKRTPYVLSICTIIFSTLGIWLPPGQPVFAQDLRLHTIEELMSIDITSASKKSEAVSRSAAAVHVITEEDIRRSSARSIVDVLRLAPGVHSAKISSLQPAITIRGLNDRLNSVLQVFIDGRSIYQNLASAVDWPFNDIDLDEIHQIEIIRGPGGTLWGENAVNGVINIITKSAFDTHGSKVTVGGGGIERLFGSARQGGSISDHTSYRISGRASRRERFDSISGSGKASDSPDEYRLSYRLDSELSLKDSLQLAGDFSHTRYNNPRNLYGSDTELLSSAIFSDHDTTPNNQESYSTMLRTRWTRTLRPNSHIEAQSSVNFIDFQYYDNKPQQLQWQSTLEHRFQPADRHDVVSGIGYQLGHDKFVGSDSRRFDPESDSYHFLSIFGQDEISFFDGDARLILGTKLSHNSFTGFEYQPNIRSAWTPRDDFTLWSAVSRAVRTPSRGEQDVIITTGLFPATEQTQGLPILAVARGSKDVEAVNLIAYEIGARHQISSNFSVDVAFFVHDYSDIVSSEFSSATPNLDPDLPRVDVETTFANELSALSHGVEVSLDYRPLPSWKLTSSYAFVDVSVWGSKSTDNCDGGDFATPFFCKFEDANAEHIISLRSLYNLSSAVSFDTFLQYVTGWKAPAVNNAVDDYLVLDVRLAWKVQEQLELALVGQNLIEENHEEWEQSGAFGGENALVPRSAYVQVSYQFN